MNKLIPLFVSLFLVLTALPVMAIYDPLFVINNKIGVHILSPDELESAAKLVNNNYQGAWGYVTVPIQATDRDREKWTRFMLKATELKVIPIIRVATVVDGSQWLKPGNTDLIDFANFLNDLPWPTQNHYVIIFNEVNRADEFGGQVSPENYTDILAYALDVFKQRSERFFILPAALDNAAPDKGNFMFWKTYLKRMYQHNPEIFKRLDGWTSHAYGNPDFSADPLKSGDNKADSFLYDLKYLNQFTPKKLPVFITEAGWSNQRLNEQTVSNFYNYALKNVWSNDQVVAVTPFLLFAGTGPFEQFSLLKKDSQPTLAYQTIQTYTSKGEPILEDYSPKPTENNIAEDISPEASISSTVLGEASPEEPKTTSLWQRIISFINGVIHPNRFTKKITVGEKVYQIEVVKKPSDISVGLAKYKKITADQGMLFDFGYKSQPNFWMKEMKFDIDLIWIDADKVVGISQGYAATPYALIPAPVPVTFVLEVSRLSGVKIGDSVKIN